MHSLSTFGAKMNHGQPRIHKIHHGKDLGEANTFPIIVYFAPLHETTSKWHFVLGFISGSLEIFTSRTLVTFGAHNYA
jgi:hypothetical protein